MKKSTSILWFLASILMIAAGIVCFALPVDTTLTTLAYVIGAIVLVIGAIVLVIGVVEIAMFFTTVGLFGGGAFLADGIITTILGIIMLSNENVVAGFLPFIFAMWFIYEGISELSMAIAAGRLKLPYWWVLLITSIFEIVFGMLAFFNPVGGAIYLTVLLGVFLLVHGISMLGDWCVAFRVKNFFRKWMGDMKTNADEIDG